MQRPVNAGRLAQPVPVDDGWLELDTLDDLEMIERLRADGGLGRFGGLARPRPAA